MPVPVVPSLYEAKVIELEHRNSGFIHIGWWELDQLVELKEQGIDWRTKLEELVHPSALVVIDEWLTENPDKEIEAQESRNGYIVKREFFEYEVANPEG